ncbi:MAG: hypothetical protein ABW172_18695 [Candidatus Binatia bacterium]
MTNAEYERALARARLALIAPTVDDVTAAYFDSQVEKVLLEARQNGEKSDQELILTLLDAVARKYFAMGLCDRHHEQSSDGAHEQSSDRDHEGSSDRDHEQRRDDRPPHPAPTRR